MAYGVSNAILAIAWLLVFIFFAVFDVMPLTGVINYVLVFIFAVLSPVSVIEQS